MEIRHIGEPQQFNSSNPDLRRFIHDSLRDLGGKVTVIQADFVKTAKMLLLLFNWERVKSNQTVHNHLVTSISQSALQTLFKKVTLEYVDELPSIFAFNRQLLDEFVNKFSENEITSILKQESNLGTTVSSVVQTNRGSFELQTVEMINPPQPFYRSSIIEYSEDGITKRVLLCISSKPEIREYQVPRGNTETQDVLGSLNAYGMIHKIVINQPSKKGIPVGVKFLIYLVLLVPLSAICVFLLHNSSKYLYSTSLNQFYEEIQLLPLHELGWGAPRKLENTTVLALSTNKSTQIKKTKTKAAKTRKQPKQKGVKKEQIPKGGKNKIPKKKAKNPLLKKKR